jgi:hypothetical protein
MRLSEVASGSEAGETAVFEETPYHRIVPAATWLSKKAKASQNRR